MATPYGQSSYGPGKPKKRRKKYIVIVVILLIAVAMMLVYIRSSKKLDKTPDIQKQEVIQAKPEVAPPPQLPNLQPVVDSWISSHPGTYSVAITDTSGKSLAETNGNQHFDTASLYKLFVAYVGYQKIDDGTYKLDQPYLGSKTREQCLDAMIRDSDSPCGEQMWNELGKQKVTDTMKSYGLSNTSLTGLQTTANDVVIILKMIANGEGLSKDSQRRYLDSMKTQDAKYRRGLPSGFKALTVYNKVGWRLDVEWHDAAIVELPSGRRVVVAVLTSSVGYQNIAGLGQALEAALQ